MNEIFKLLEDKNYWFKKYLAGNEAFALALEHEPVIATDELDFFYGNRESLLKIIESIDKKVQEILDSAAFENFVPNSEQKTKINYYIRDKDAILHRILELDEKIMTSLDKIRVDGEEKIRNMHKGKKALANYKSANKTNERLNKRV
jgi:hypothetical protein